MNDKSVEAFIGLTEKALSEKDFDRFAGYLAERDSLVAAMIYQKPQIDEVSLKYALLVESKILERLESERAEVLKAMDDLSKSRKATKAYSPRFPLPPMPVFFDKKE
jgi:hypothetical protein